MKNICLLIAISIFLSASGTIKETTSTSVSKPIPQVVDPQKYAQTITSDELKTALYTYASDEFQGRETGKPGQKMAVNFLKDAYSELGIPAAKKNGDYFQEVPLDIIKTPDITFSIDGTTFTYIEDFVSATSGMTTKFSTQEVIYIGYGIEDTKFSSYNNTDISGKVVLVKSGEPMNEDGTYIISGTNEPSKWSADRQQLALKKDIALEKGAKMVLFYTPNNYDQIGQRFADSSGRMTLTDTNDKTYIFFINDTIAKKLLMDIDTDEETKSLKTELVLDYNNNSEKITSENVAAFIKGSEKPDEIIVISAHLDHEGIKDGEIYNGADDDGSGTVAVLEIAEAFAEALKDGNGPKRSILFLNVTAEEKGLLGSSYYTDVDPIFPLKNTVANLNIDMIGRTDPKRTTGDRNYIYLIGSDKLSSELHSISENMNNKYTNIDLDYTFNDENDSNRFYYRSDHYNFAKNNIPVIFYFNGTHDDYHRPSDTVDKIEYDLLENRTKLVFYTAWELANREKRIVVDKVGVE